MTHGDELLTPDQFEHPDFREIPSADHSLEELRMKLADAEKQTLIAKADLDNFRRRTRKEMQDQLKYASLDLIASILDAHDNLLRAVEASRQEGHVGGLLEGVEMVGQQIMHALEQNGCRKIPADPGDAFDPALHQAVQMQTSVQYPANTIIADYRSGYLLHDRVVRPAQVAVSSGS